MRSGHTIRAKVNRTVCNWTTNVVGDPEMDFDDEHSSSKLMNDCYLPHRKIVAIDERD